MFWSIFARATSNSVYVVWRMVVAGRSGLWRIGEHQRPYLSVMHPYVECTLLKMYDYANETMRNVLRSGSGSVTRKAARVQHSRSCPPGVSTRRAVLQARTNDIANRQPAWRQCA